MISPIDRQPAHRSGDGPATLVTITDYGLPLLGRVLSGHVRSPACRTPPCPANCAPGDLMTASAAACAPGQPAPPAPKRRPSSTTPPATQANRIPATNSALAHRLPAPLPISADIHRHGPVGGRYPAPGGGADRIWQQPGP